MGHIPEDIGDFVIAKTLTLGENDLTGTIIPEFLSTMTKLEAIRLFDMKLYGTIPPSLFDIPELYAVGLGGNNLNGTIPENI